MHHGVEGAALFVDAAQNGGGDLAEIAEIDADAGADGLGQGLLVEVEHVKTMLDQVAQDGAS